MDYIAHSPTPPAPSTTMGLQPVSLYNESNSGYILLNEKNNKKINSAECTNIYCQTIAKRP